MTLNERELDLLKMKEERQTLQAMANKYGLSRERIRQILIKAETKKRHQGDLTTESN